MEVKQAEGSAKYNSISHGSTTPSPRCGFFIPHFPGLSLGNSTTPSGAHRDR
jgi:hypothetical protein